MVGDLRKAVKVEIAALHKAYTALENLFTLNEEELKTIWIQDPVPGAKAAYWNDQASWKFTKAVEHVLSAKKALIKIVEKLPQERKTKDGPSSPKLNDTKANRTTAKASGNTAKADPKPDKASKPDSKDSKPGRKPRTATKPTVKKSRKVN